MEYLPPFVVHGAHTIRQSEISAYAEKYKRALIMLRDGKIDLNKMKRAEYFNELID
jgi:glutathione-regulated potassium-efflux system ancillary protein KefG